MANTPNPDPSLLSGDQILGRVMDEANDRLRVSTEATVINGAVEVAIDADTGDTIAIKDPTLGNTLKINSDGSINVVGGGGGGGTSNVNIHDAAGNNLTSTAGALNVFTSGSSTVTGSVTTNQAGLTSFQTSQYTVGLSVIQLAPTPLSNRSSISIRVGKDNTGAVYIGNSNGVTISNGYPLFAGDTISMDLTYSGDIFAVADIASQNVSLLEIA